MKSTSVLLVLLASLAGCAKQSSDASVAAVLPAVRVPIARVVATDAPILTEVTGTVRPAQRATLAAKVMGTVEELPVMLGQRVAAGDLLLKISAREIGARVAQAQAQLSVARRDLERERALLSKGASTADMVRGLEDRFAMSEAATREAETMLGYAELRAPFAGVVTRKLVHAGDLAAPGQPLLEIEGAGDFEIEFGIPDSLAADLQTGTELLVQPPGSETTFRARLIELSPAADAQARTVAAKLAVPADAPVRSGQFVRVHVPAGQVTALLVPASAVSASGQMERVFVVEQGRAVLRLVKTGATHDGSIEILSGLSAGETVVAVPPAGLREGQPLEVQS
ncbi:MAG: efflux RND transporter periplasmic adaptor subunit [Opitutus sp.]|nr:efflux RND transporter periplasmic adaptor subunit [Opitutus sp.]